MGRRKILYIPEINPDTFLFFYSKGETGRSYSFRDYSQEGSSKPTYARIYPYTDGEILAMARWCFDADPVDTNDLHYWHDQVLTYNRRFLKQTETGSGGPGANSAQPISPHPTGDAPCSDRPAPIFPILALDRLRAHPVKGKKTRDLDRIFTSPNSEDYVTWNVMQLLQQCQPAAWWPGLLQLLQADNPRFSLPCPGDDTPVLEAWTLYPAPARYEQSSRQRMGRSQIPQIVERSRNPKPVEGESEIDLLARGRSYLMFVEAKLESDISMATTYDPDRNQIIRNIDVLLDVCGDRTPVFCMLVKDQGPGRAYTQLMHLYRSDPEALVRALPHRDPQRLQQVAGNLAVMRWKDVLNLIPTGLDDPVIIELNRRIV